MFPLVFSMLKHQKSGWKIILSLQSTQATFQLIHWPCIATCSTFLAHIICFTEGVLTSRRSCLAKIQPILLFIYPKHVLATGVKKQLDLISQHWVSFLIQVWDCTTSRAEQWTLITKISESSHNANTWTNLSLSDRHKIPLQLSSDECRCKVIMKNLSQSTIMFQEPLRFTRAPGFSTLLHPILSNPSRKY